LAVVSTHLRAARGPATAGEGRAPAGVEREAAISQLVSGLVSEYIGSAPRARTYLNGNVLTVVVEDSLTAGEQRLVRDGMRELVLSTRRAFQQTMREDLIAGVEQLTGRRVRLSANEMAPDIAVEVFVLDSEGVMRQRTSHSGGTQSQPPMAGRGHAPWHRPSG
jgi:uncharacterized protein YbcI